MLNAKICKTFYTFQSLWYILGENSKIYKII